MRKLSIFVLILSIYLIGSCKKAQTYFPIEDPRLVAGVSFKPGSYFVYEDSVTGRTDTFTITSTRHWDMLVLPENNVTDETLQYCAVNNSKSDSFEVFAVRYNIGIALTFNSNPRPGPFYSIHLVELPKVISWVNDTIPGQRQRYLQHYDTFPVSGTSYTDVYESDKVYTYGTNDTVHSFYSLNSGLVQYRTSRNGTVHLWKAKKIFIVK